MRADIVAALISLGIGPSIPARHIELACSDVTDNTYQRFAGTGKRPKSAAQQQREAKRRKNSRKRNK